MLDQHHDKIFSFLHNTSFWTIASGTLGGVYKTIEHPSLLLNAVSLEGTISVAAYAFVSASMGYCTKKLMDFLFKKFKKN